MMADSIEFKAPEIGLNKVIKVAKTNGNLRQVWQFQLTLAKASADDEHSDIEELQSALALLDQAEAFLATLLKLTAKQKNALEEIDQATLFGLVNRLSLALQGLEPKDIEDREDPK